MSTKTFPGQGPSAFPIFLILSILIHIGIWAALALLPTGGPSASPRRPPVLVDVVDLPPMAPGALSPSAKAPSAFAQRSQSVRTETRPAPAPRAAVAVPVPRPAPARPGAPTPPPPKETATRTKAAAEPGLPPGPLDEPVSAELVRPADGAREQAGPQPKIMAEPRRPGLFPTDDRIAELTRRYESDAPKGEVGKTLSLNTSELKYQKYLMDMKRKIEFHWEYPHLAARNGWQGSLKIDFKINKDGSVSDISLERSSGYPMLDDAAITAVRLSAPFPPFPENFTVPDISIKGQFTYHLMVPAGLEGR